MSLPFSTQPPAERVPYAIPQLEGERITIPGSKGVFRILTSSKQTDELMAVFQSGAVLSDAPGFYYHNQAHDVFLVTKGYLKLYNRDKCRIMAPGDFAYIPPVCNWPRKRDAISRKTDLIASPIESHSQSRHGRPAHRASRPHYSW
jgi:Cupin domain.